MAPQGAAPFSRAAVAEGVPDHLLERLHILHQRWAPLSSQLGSWALSLGTGPHCHSRLGSRAL